MSYPGEPIALPNGAAQDRTAHEKADNETMLSKGTVDSARAVECAEGLVSWFPALGRVVVAFSGGVDSSLVLTAAVRACGTERVTAVIADSASLPRRELQDAISIATDLGTPPEIISTDEMTLEGYRKNDGNRCYFCKSALYSAALAKFLDDARAPGDSPSARKPTVFVDGTNLDDLSEDRPGLRAAAEAGVRHPLADSGLRKEDVRLVSKLWGLPTWNKPALACLASRLPRGTSVDERKLSQIELAEDAVFSLGFRGARVRYHELPNDGGAQLLARIELPAAELSRLAAHPERLALTETIRKIGFAFVTLDLEGYRKGGTSVV